jgi:DinB superfamily
MVTLVLSAVLSMPAPPPEPPTSLRAVLIEQLQTTHNMKEWFAPAMIAVDGLTAEQASWRDGKGNHSVGQLAAHLVFWNRQQLAKFNGLLPESFSGDNNETFDRFDAAKWSQIVRDLDQVMGDWEKAVEGADEAKLQKWASTIAHIGAHNAYHIGQMIYSRKLQGTWDPDKGVK